MENFLAEYGYLALMIGTFLEGETAILVAASLIYKGFFEIPQTVFFAFAGSFVSDWLYFALGRLNGKYFIARRPKLQKHLVPVQNFFDNNKLQILLSYRFLYGFRTLIPLIIGMSKIKLSQFLLFSILSGVLWASVVSTLGYVVGRYFKIETSVFEENIMFIVLGFALFALLTGYLIKKVTYKKIANSSN